MNRLAMPTFNACVTGPASYKNKLMFSRPNRQDSKDSVGLLPDCPIGLRLLEWVRNPSIRSADQFFRVPVFSGSLSRSGSLIVEFFGVRNQPVAETTLRPANTVTRLRAEAAAGSGFAIHVAAFQFLEPAGEAMAFFHHLSCMSGANACRLRAERAPDLDFDWRSVRVHRENHRKVDCSVSGDAGSPFEGLC